MFTHLHLHTAKGSLLDSILTVEQAVKFAKDNGHKAMALTDHGSMSSFVDFVKECKKNDIKPIIGNEVYEVDDMSEKADTKDYYQPRYHLILLAKTQEGYKNLIKITSISRTDGFYKKPRIDIDYIKEHGLGKGIICSTACQAGRLSRYLVMGEDDKAWEFFQKLQGTFDYVVCELQSHSTDAQMYANSLIHFFAIKHKLPYIITTDAHMLSDSLLDSHAMFVEIGESREVGESYTDCYLQTEDEIYEKMSSNFSEDIIKAGIEETNHIADMIEDIDIGLNKGNIMPKVNIEGGYEDHEEYLRHLVFSTFDEKFGRMSKEEQEKRIHRLETELPVLYAVGYTDYFIMLYMLAKEARKRRIPLGYSRGSGANCLCLFMLNVTQIDSVRWDLDFSRFANLGRTSMADYDWDISKRRRKEMVEISEELFGKENVAPIATFNTLSTKVAIRDIGKVLNEKQDSPYYQQIPYTMRDEVAKMIPTIKTLNDLGEEEEKDVLLKDILSKNKKLEDIYNKFPLWFKYVMDVEGLPKSMGRHAAGTLITPTPITDYCPLCYDSEKNIMIELEMHNAMDDLGLIKMDYLGLETLDIIDDALKMAGITWEDVDINHLDLCDKEVFDNVYKKGNTVGIFQMESAEAKKMCVEAQADNVEDIIVVNAANRPGTKDSFPDYCKNKLHPEDATVLHEDLRTIFGKTQYVLLYQEQALQLFRYANFPENEVDNARRSMGKKQKDVMAKLESRFTKSLSEKGWTNEQLIEIWQLLLKQSSYCFNRGHAVAYGLLSYLTAYLKTHYTIYFMASLLTSKSDKVEKISIVINDCKRLGIKVSPPNVNISNMEFTALPDKNEILFGLLAVKGLGESIVKNIIENRPYTSFNDFTDKVNDKTAIVTLIKAGAIPTKNKVASLQKYAAHIFDKREFKPVASVPSPYSKLLQYGINVDDYKDGKKVDKDKLLNDYNNIRKKMFDEDQQKRFKAHMEEFRDKYARDEYMWEFDTLSMFLTNDPLEDAYKYTKMEWNDVEDNEKITLFCVIVDIKRKKDKNGNQFAYLDLYTPSGIIEATIWSSQLKEYGEYIKKGNCLAMLGRKREGNHFFVEKVKLYNTWVAQMKERGAKS